MMPRKTREDLGLAITCLDSDRLRQWAEKLDIHGPDVSNFADRRFVCEQLRAIAGRIEATVAEVGTLREMAGIHPASAPVRSSQPSGARPVLQRLGMGMNCVRYLLEGHDETIAFSTVNDAAKVWELLRRIYVAEASLLQGEGTGTQNENADGLLGNTAGGDA